MTEKIKDLIDDPEKLERLYRNDSKSFEQDFQEIYQEIENTGMAKFWKSRLDFERITTLHKELSVRDIFILIAVCFFAALLIKIPGIFDIDLKNYLFYEKNAGIIFFMGLTAYSFAVKSQSSAKNLIRSIIVFIIVLIYMNLIPDLRSGTVVNLVFIFMPLLMLSLYGLVFIDFDLRNRGRRIDFIRHIGDMAIIGALILIAGGILAIITLGLFKAIGMMIQKFYVENIIIPGLMAAPVLAAFILKNWPAITARLAPLIAAIFSPVVLVTLIVYLLTIIVTGKDPYNDRDFLLVFNIMLIGVMAIIVFSVSETSFTGRQRFNEVILLVLSVVTLIVNLIALSAIFYRLNEFGLTPNRLAILGSNLLIFVNLILIMIDLFRINFRKSELEKVALTISGYLPVYVIWVLIVVFVFPIIFGMK